MNRNFQINALERKDLKDVGQGKRLFLIIFFQKIY